MKKPIAAFVLLVTVVGVGAACRPRPFPPSPPPAPGNVVLTAGDRSITATFSRAPRTLLADYRLTCNAPPVSVIPPQGPGWTLNIRTWNGVAATVEGRTSPLVLSLADRMVNGVTFTCTVQTVTRHGVSAPSAPQTVTPVGPPKVASTLPVSTTAGAALVFVNVFLESDDFAGFTCEVDAPGIVEQSPNSCTFTVSGLAPATDDTATVTPSTSHGAGEPVTVGFRTG